MRKKNAGDDVDTSVDVLKDVMVLLLFLLLFCYLAERDKII